MGEEFAVRESRVVGKRTQALAREPAWRVNINTEEPRCAPKR